MKTFALRFQFKKFIVLMIFGYVVFLGLTSAAFAQGVSQVVQNVSAVPYNSGAEVSWEQTLDTIGNPASSYEISYGLYSVEEGLAGTYDQMINTENSDLTYVLSGLTNGVRYYLAAKAVFADGMKSPDFSTEVVVTPSSVYPDLPENNERAAAEEPQNDGESPVVESAVALTQTLVKISFSEDILLPEVLPSLSFTVSESLTPSAFVPVDSVEYKTDYKGEGEKEEVHRDVVFVHTVDPLDADKEFTVVVSAAITDLADNPIDSGITDSASFMGTDVVEIPENERPLVTTGDEPSATAPAESVETDVEAPESITDFIITSVPRLNDFLLNMNWKKSASDDVSFQTMYKSDDSGSSWENAASFDKDTQSHTASAEPASEPYYKITATDTSGNTNSGTIQSIRLPALPATGAPLALIAFGAAFSLGGFRRFTKK